ncbi:hypothetical protein AOZ06_47045 [Kibdelosporangium phytohabitans]|uniref:Uncharacterized protein n=1 Tax=Kibdelosporangium phytohabitans TaxID=860235 RepID=A0A0N7F572_9PSEU|nr:hypothetical protein AOZ06_47045 [Kibdelosporangium phytohabitans]
MVESRLLMSTMVSFGCFRHGLHALVAGLEDLWRWGIVSDPLGVVDGPSDALDGWLTMIRGR